MLWFYNILPYIEPALRWVIGALQQLHIWHW